MCICSEYTIRVVFIQVAKFNERVYVYVVTIFMPTFKCHTCVQRGRWYDRRTEPGCIGRLYGVPFSFPPGRPIAVRCAYRSVGRTFVCIGSCAQCLYESDSFALVGSDEARSGVCVCASKQSGRTNEGKSWTTCPCFQLTAEELLNSGQRGGVERTWAT